MPTRSSDAHARSAGKCAGLFAGLFAALTIVGCGKKDQAPEKSALPKSLGAASADFLATSIGNGMGLRVDLAATSTVWERIVVDDEQGAVLLGRDGTEAVALRTRDLGRTWTSMRVAAKEWSAWGLGTDGSLAFMTGAREKQPKAPPAAKFAPPRRAPVLDAELWTADPGDLALSGPRPFFPDQATLKDVRLPSGYGQPARVEGGGIALLLDLKAAPLIASAIGEAAPIGTPIDKTLRERFVPVPYGRPAQLVSVAASAVRVRPWPRPADVLGPSSVIPGANADANTWAQLAAGPQCEWGGWSVVRLAGPVPRLVGIAGERALAMPLPASDSDGLGCGPNAVVTEIAVVDPSDPQKKRRIPQLVRCGFDGKCSVPQSLPFVVWPEPHERSIKAVPTASGLVALMHARAGERWGLYLGQSTDGGATFELARAIGEGKSDRGHIDVGAVVRFQSRVLLLLSADVTGTSRRGWYVLASDNDGTSWGPP
ncbi:MAG: hypothetical protein EXR75_07145 [Myxococcales bacterium]|nr:hypothetical protein [Myxococcales bacterium]